MSQLALYLLGPPRVELDGVELHVSRRKAMALLAYLAATGRSHSRDSLATLLFPEYDQSRALAYLRRILSALNTTLGEIWLDADHETAGLDPNAEVWLDVDAFRQHLAACGAHGHPPTEPCPDCIPLLEEAVGLYRDDFMAGFTLPDCPAFDDFQRYQTEGLKDELASVLVRLATYRTSQGNLETAIGHARRWLALDPLHEPAHRYLMVLYAQSGQRAAALRQCETCEKLLADELGVEPSERTQETYQRLLNGELPVGPTAVEAILERELRTVGECPYRGLAPFREADALFFFGREEFADRLMDAVRTQPMVAVIVGSSGSGKSSAVFAGLLPRLREEGDWLIPALRPGAQPFHALAAALLPSLEPELRETDRLVEARKLASALEERDVPLYDVVERALEKSTATSRLLLLVDQFEELYTLCPEPEVRRDFVDALLAAVGTTEGRREPPFVLLLTMRADFMGQALAHRPFADALQEASLMLGPMTRDELRAAVERPAEIQGAAQESGLVERLLDDVGDEPGNLPLLEFALMLLWERLDYGWMTHAAYEEIGRVEGALARYAQEVYDGLGEGEREGARRVFTQLVQPGEETADTRRVATRAELGDGPVLGGQDKGNWALVQHLADKRLVVTGRDPTTGRETVEVVHEALIQRWDQLRGWMAEDRAFRIWQERLRTALGQWQATGEDEGVLLRGALLAEAEGWLAEHEGKLSANERAFIRASAELRELEAAERQRRRRRIFAGLSAGLVIAVVLALVAVWQRREALVQASIGLAALAEGELDGAAPERAILLALEALEQYPYTGQAESALARAVEAYHDYVPLPNEEDRIWGATWSPDGKWIVTTGYSGIMKIWDADTGEELMSFGVWDSSDVRGAAWSADGARIATASQGLQAARVWDAETGALLLTFEGHGDAVNSVALSRDGTLALTASADGTARVWEVETGVERLVLEGHRDAVTDARWSTEEDHVLTASMDGTVRLWDAETGEELFFLNAHTDGALSATWSPDGKQIATSGVDGVARVWDVVTGEVLFAFIGHDGEVRDVDWSPDERRIATASGDGTIRVWDARVGDELFVLHGIQTPMVVAWSPDGERLVGGGGFAVRVWDVSSESIRLEYTGWTVDAQWSPDMSLIATASEGSIARVWDAATGELLTTFTGHVIDESRLHYTWFFSWSPSGELIVTTGEDHTARIWDPLTGEELLTFLHDEAFLQKADWSPDGTRIASGIWGTTGGPVYVWDAESGEQLVTFGSECLYSEPEWSPDGTRIVSQCSAETDDVVVWDAATGEPLVRFTNHDGPPHSADWSPDGKRIVSGGFDATVRIWDAETGEEYLVFSGHNGIVFDAEWSPDGTRIASGDEDGFVRVWDAETGEEVYRAEFPGGVIGVEWSPDGKYLIVSGIFAVPEIRRVWQSTGELIDYAHQCCVSRELTPEEREQFGLGPRRETESLRSLMTTDNTDRNRLQCFQPQSAFSVIPEQRISR